MRKNGADGLAFDTIAVNAENSSRPHGVPSTAKLKDGFLTLDFGARFNGYCSDMTRTVVIGKADEDMKLLYNTVLSAQLAAEEAIVEGVTGAELDKIARDIIDGSKFKGCFGHSLGHGVGMYVHEAPGVSGGNNTPMKKGHVITIEPGIYVRGTYGCRIEDMAAFRENGPQILTNCPKHLIEL
jgi:Xaa-Pro aminopeptidase